MVNPFAFTSMAVTIVVALVYIAVFAPLLVLHTTVPAAPKNETQYRGLNITEAWLDLAELSNGYHPFNSRRNDEVRNWLLLRIAQILDSNNVEYRTQSVDSTITTKHTVRTPRPATVRLSTTSHNEYRVQNITPSAVIFNDLVSNYTSTALTSIGVSGRRAGISTYFEGNNIIVYIRGSEDEDGEWWKPTGPYSKRLHGKGGIMVNAHFDSVSTGFGATDDGVGVVTALQMVKYFTTTGNIPKRGVVVLFNNGEEDGLYGAKAFLSHPMASFVHAFLNLEGAGAGGKAMLFRSTDTEVTRAYGKAPHPFGTVVSADGFSLGFVRSETDYVVFRAEGYRGLDVAFWEPRAMYHTDQDDARHTSKASLWHMLSASIETMLYLTDDTDEFVGPRGDGENSKVSNGKGSVGVWFDLFGMKMAVMKLRTLFAASLAMLIATPLLLIVVSYILVKCDRYYLFANSVRGFHHTIMDVHGHNIELMSIKGWHGAFRFPIVLILSVAITGGVAFVVQGKNPLIVYSSQYSVWAMSMSVFFFSFWAFMALCNHVRPTALQRLYSLVWMFIFSWFLLVAATVSEDRFNISSGYLFVVYQFTVFLATFVGLCELFALPRKFDVVQEIFSEHSAIAGNIEGSSMLPHADAMMHPRRDTERTVRIEERFHEGGHHHHHGGGYEGYDGPAEEEEEAQEANEETPLVGNSLEPRARSFGNSLGAFFARGYQKAKIAQVDGPGDTFEHGGDGASHSHEHGGNGITGHHHHARVYGDYLPYGHEQMWSSRMPQWTWLLQFLLLAPITIIVLGQVGMMLVTALAQTGTDGSPLFLPYAVIALFSVLLLLPIGPFMHRIKLPLPMFLLLIFVATLIYNMATFPFSPNNRYKAYFQQTVDLDTGINTVTLAGVEEYIREIIAQLPSAAGQNISCVEQPQIRAGLSFCSWHGLAPKVVDNVVEGIPPEKMYQDWLNFNVIRKEGKNAARFHVSGRETKACILRFDEPFTKFSVKGAASSDGRWADVPESGSDQIKLWHRDWDKEWVVDVAWPVSEGKVVGEEGRSGRVVCLWSDHNMLGTIPALDEAQRFAPAWTSIVKVMDGLVEGSKPFVV